MPNNYLLKMHRLKTLLEGVDPETNRQIDQNKIHVYEELVDEFRAALMVLENAHQSYRQTFEERRRANEIWNREEEELILKQYENGDYVEDIAIRFQRTDAAISSRLMKMKKFKPRHPRKKTRNA